MKFKVWCKNKNEWEKDKCFISDDGQLYQQSRLNMIVPLSLKTHVVCWYTGRKDIDDEEIYQGSVLTLESYPYIDENVQNYVGIVTWIHTGFHIVLKCVSSYRIGISDGMTEPLDSSSDFKIIGDVFNTPEYL